MIGRNDADSKVKLFVPDGNLDPAVSRSSFLGDVDFGQDFDSGNDCREHPSWCVLTFNTNTVNAVSDAYPILKRFHVDIAGSQLNRLLDHQIDQSDHLPRPVHCQHLFR